MFHLISPIQIVLVFDNAATFDSHFGDLHAIEPRLKTAVQDFGSWDSLRGYNTPDHLGLATDTRHVTLQRYTQKMDIAGFADVLANPLVSNAKPALAQAIMQHQRAILVEVGAGAVPGFAASLMQSGIGAALGDLGMGLSDDQAGYENRLLLAQTVTMALIKEMAPSAIHWVQSQQVFDAPTFTNLAAEGFSLSLYCGPFIFGAEQLADGSVKAGVRALGSQNLLGRMVIFKPSVQSWADSYVQILSFVAYCRSIGRILDDGETMASDAADATVIRVSHKTDIPQLPDGYIELSVDGRSNAARMSGPTYHADLDQLTAAMNGTRNGLSGRGAGAGAGGVLGRLWNKLRGPKH